MLAIYGDLTRGEGGLLSAPVEIHGAGVAGEQTVIERNQFNRVLGEVNLNVDRRLHQCMIRIRAWSIRWRGRGVGRELRCQLECRSCWQNYNVRHNADRLTEIDGSAENLESRKAIHRCTSGKPWGVEPDASLTKADMSVRLWRDQDTRLHREDAENIGGTSVSKSDRSCDGENMYPMWNTTTVYEWPQGSFYPHACSPGRCGGCGGGQ